MGSLMRGTSTRNPDNDEDEPQSKLGEQDEENSEVGLGELLSGRLSEADVDSVSAVRAEREP